VTLMNDVNAKRADGRHAFACDGGSVIRAALEQARRWGAAGAFRLASRILRRATVLHQQRRISHNCLRTVLSGTLLLERFGALLALGRRQKDQDIQSERTDCSHLLAAPCHFDLVAIKNDLQ